MIPVDQTALMMYLKARSDLYFGKVLELKADVGRWLSYIPHTFPHYTLHTIEHSDEVVRQASKILFTEDDPQQPRVQLSAAEAYILIAAAYLHDSGMVVSGKELESVIRSEEWKEWTTRAGAGVRRWEEIQRLRNGSTPADPAVRDFLADLQTRFLLAEFVRRTHHFRAVTILEQHQTQFGRFAFDDPLLFRTIADICVAHGLRTHELEDQERFPDRRDVRGELTNVRFLAIVLRLADLSDMSSDRACPLLLNAACPLPADSLAHWTQYQRIAHKLVAPDRIELRAECVTQDEHRFIQDWCQWLVDEARNAASLMARTSRHSTWRPPHVSLEGPSRTMEILPAKGATYIPSRWTFEIDPDDVFSRLIHDVHGSPQVFIRELIQNALDANRCQMYADLAKEGKRPPSYPTQVPEGFRRRYPVEISLQHKTVHNPMSDEMEERQVLTVNDHGIGMDHEIVQRYFLQVGRSFYTTEEFRRTYGFVPASRFGVGFLSVFATSDHVTVETYKPSSLTADGPLRMTLTGPRNYLLTHQGTRSTTGTRVDVLLRTGMSPGQLTQFVAQWCPRVEFSISVDDLGTVTAIESERPDQFTYEMPVLGELDATLAVRAYPVERDGIAGELYMLLRTDKNGEDWAVWGWANHTYPYRDPRASRPAFPGRLACLHGIAMNWHDPWFRQHPSYRLDIRRSVPGLPLSREGTHLERVERLPEVVSRWDEILSEHISTAPRAKLPDGWKYRQSLADHFPMASIWPDLPGTFRVFIEGGDATLSFKEVQALPRIAIVLWIGGGFYRSDRDDGGHAAQHLEEAIGRWHQHPPAMTETDLDLVAKSFQAVLFVGKMLESVEWGPGQTVVFSWVKTADRHTRFAKGPAGIHLLPLPAPQVIAIPAHKAEDDIYTDVVFNRDHPLVKWLVNVGQAGRAGQHGLTVEQYDVLVRLLDQAARYPDLEIPKLTRYLQAWRDMSGLPAELIPPDLEMSSGLFRLQRIRER